MPDPTSTPPTKRMTTADVAALAQDVDSRLDDLSAVVTDVSTRLQDMGTLSERAANGGTSGWLTRDQLAQHVHEALAPLHDEMHEIRQRTPLTSAPGDRDAILARLEEVERKVTTVEPGAVVEQVAQHLHPTMSDLRKRVGLLEAEHEASGNPVAEDALAELTKADDQGRERLEWLTGKLADLTDYVRRLDGEISTVQAGRTNTQATTAGGLGAARKVLQLMRMVTHIGKEKEANLGEKGGRFKFRGVDDAMDAVGHAVREVGVVIGTKILKDETTRTPITKAGTNKDGTRWENTVVWTSTKLTVRYTFTDPEDGSTHSLEMTGEGRDASDKSTSKAASMALKYGLFQALMIPINGLDDSDDAPPQVMENERSTAPAQRPVQASSQPSSNTDQKASDQATAKRAGEALAAIRNVYRVEGGPQAQYNRLVHIMNQVKSEGLLDFTVEGSTLYQHGEAARRTLQAAPPPDDARASTEPPEPPEDYR